MAGQWTGLSLRHRSQQHCEGSLRCFFALLSKLHQWLSSRRWYLLYIYFLCQPVQDFDGFSSSNMIQLSEPCLFWILLLHWFRCPISGLLAPGKQLVRVVAMALNLWSMGYPGRHDREWKCTSQNIILKRSEPQQRPSSAFFESFRSLNTKLKSVKHTIYVQLSYYKYCFFKCFFIIFLIVSTTTLWRWLLRKLWSLEAQPVPKCRGLRSGPGNWESFLPSEGAVGLGKWISNPEASYFGWKNRKNFGWTFWCYKRYFAKNGFGNSSFEIFCWKKESSILIL